MASGAGPSPISTNTTPSSADRDLHNYVAPLCDYGVVTGLRVDLAYDAAVRVLDEQRLTIDSNRTRAGLLLTAAIVLNVELGRAALTGIGDPEPAFVAGAIIAAVLTACYLGYLCIPQACALGRAPQTSSMGCRRSGWQTNR